MTEILKNFGKAINLWPETDYHAFIPSQPPSEEAWRSTGEHLTKALVVYVIRSNANQNTLIRFNSVLRDMEEGSCFEELSNCDREERRTAP